MNLLGVREILTLDVNPRGRGRRSSIGQSSIYCTYSMTVVLNTGFLHAADLWGIMGKTRRQTRKIQVRIQVARQHKTNAPASELYDDKEGVRVNREQVV